MQDWGKMNKMKKKKKSYDWETNRMSGRRLRNRALFFF